MENKPYLAVYADTGEPVIFKPRAYCPNMLAMADLTPKHRKVKAPRHRPKHKRIR